MNCQKKLHDFLKYKISQKKGQYRRQGVQSTNLITINQTVRKS